MRIKGLTSMITNYPIKKSTQRGTPKIFFSDLSRTFSRRFGQSPSALQITKELLFNTWCEKLSRNNRPFLATLHKYWACHDQTHPKISNYFFSKNCSWFTIFSTLLSSGIIAVILKNTIFYRKVNNKINIMYLLLRNPLM